MRTMIRATLAAVLSVCAFAVLAAPAAKGPKRLPPGGGEPGAAYLGYFAAIEKGDVAALKRMRLPDIEGWADDEIAEWAKRMKTVVPTSVKVVDGTVDGDTATLHVTAVETGEPEWGTVTMKKADGVWRKADASWTVIPPKKK